MPDFDPNSTTLRLYCDAFPAVERRDEQLSGRGAKYNAHRVEIGLPGDVPTKLMSCPVGSCKGKIRPHPKPVSKKKKRKSKEEAVKDG